MQESKFDQLEKPFATEGKKNPKLVVLVKIGGKSDGPGALFFYIGLFVGLGGGVMMLFSLPPRE